MLDIRNAVVALTARACRPARDQTREPVRILDARDEAAASRAARDWRRRHTPPSSSSSVTSPVPSASDGTIGSSDVDPEPLRVVRPPCRRRPAGAAARRRDCSTPSAPREGCTRSPRARRRQPRRAVGVDRRVEIAQHRPWRVAALERRRVDDRLECRAGLPPRLRRAVERALAKLRPPTSASTSPVAGSIATRLPWRSCAPLAALRDLARCASRSPARPPAAAPDRRSSRRAGRRAARARCRTS